MIYQSNQDEGFYSSFLKRRFKTHEAAEVAENEAIDAAERQAGRRLHAEDYRLGSLSDRVDNRTTRQRVADQTRKVLSLVPGQGPNEEANLYDKLLAYRRASKPESYEQMLERKSTELATDSELQRRVDAFHQDPERVELVKQTTAIVERARWNPEVEMSEWSQVQHILETAKVGDLELTRGMLEDHEYAVTERAQIKRLTIEAQIAELKTQLV